MSGARGILLHQLVKTPLGGLAHHQPQAVARLVGRDLGAVDPAAIREPEEVVARPRLFVFAGHIESKRSILRLAGGAGVLTAQDEPHRNGEDDHNRQQEPGLHGGFSAGSGDVSAGRAREPFRAGHGWGERLAGGGAGGAARRPHGSRRGNFAHHRARFGCAGLGTAQKTSPHELLIVGRRMPRWSSVSRRFRDGSASRRHDGRSASLREAYRYRVFRRPQVDVFAGTG